MHSSIHIGVYTQINPYIREIWNGYPQIYASVAREVRKHRIVKVFAFIHEGEALSLVREAVKKNFFLGDFTARMHAQIGYK